MGKVFNFLMRIVSSLIGLLMVAMGAIWIMQGLHMGPAVIMQGFMVGDMHWVYYGAALAFVGLLQLIWSNMRQGLDSDYY